MGERGFLVRAGRPWLHAVPSLVVLRVLTGTAGALADPSDGTHRGSPAQVPAAADDQIAARMERRRWRKTPEGRAGLRRSANAYRAMPADAAVRLLRQTFPEMRRRTWQPPSLENARFEDRGLSHSALLPGDGPQAQCDRLDRRFVGSHTDGRYEGDDRVDDKSGGAQYHSARGQRRPSFCLLRNATVSLSRCSLR